MMFFNKNMLSFFLVSTPKRKTKGHCAFFLGCERGSREFLVFFFKMSDEKYWSYLATLEEQAQTMLKWDAKKVANASQKELETAISQFQKAQELEQKHESKTATSDCEATDPDRKLLIVDLSFHSRAPNINSTGINQHLLDQLITCYCAASSQPVTAATIEKVLFPQTGQ